MHDENDWTEPRDTWIGSKRPRDDTGPHLELVSGEGARISAFQPTLEAAVRAMVRISPNGEVLMSEGDQDMFAELVAYLTRLGAVLGAELALEPFESLHAELGGERLLVFLDGPDTVGLLLHKGPTAQELRQHLGH